MAGEDSAYAKRFALRPVDTPRRSPVLPREHMPQVECAFCGSSDTEPTGIYGCHMMLSQYYCRGCHSSFEWVREEGQPATQDRG